MSGKDIREQNRIMLAGLKGIVAAWSCYAYDCGEDCQGGSECKAINERVRTTLAKLGIIDTNKRLVIGVREAAALLDVCTKTILRWIASGKLNATRPGKHWKIPIAEVHKYAGVIKKYNAR